MLNQSKLDQFFTENRKPLAVLARRLGAKTEMDIEDAIQESYFKFYRSLANVNDGDEFKYLCRILRNTIRDQQRHHRRKHIKTDLFIDFQDEEFMDPNALSHVAALECDDCFESLLALVSPEIRVIYESIIRDEGLTPTQRSRIFRFRQRLVKGEVAEGWAA